MGERQQVQSQNISLFQKVPFSGGSWIIYYSHDEPVFYIYKNIELILCVRSQNAALSTMAMHDHLDWIKEYPEIITKRILEKLSKKRAADA